MAIAAPSHTTISKTTPANRVRGSSYEDTQVSLLKTPKAEENPEVSPAFRALSRDSTTRHWRLSSERARLQLACQPATIFLHATAIGRDRLSGDSRLAATSRYRHPRGGLALQHRSRFFRHHALRFQHGSRSTHSQLGSTQANDHPRLETEAGEIKCPADRQVVLACEEEISH